MVNGLDFPSIDENDRLLLDRKFTKEDVIHVLKEMNGDKAPSLDGFTTTFFRKCWRVVERDVVVFFADFHRDGVFEKSLNASVLALIPQKE